ncbi:MAG: ABC transporter permease [Bacteroidales bacterium]|nr:ABC transporter permease [Bacteroidales bacterium]
MDLLKIAWRNLWRNKRRTAITVASILFAVFFAISMRSMQLGSYNQMIKSMIKSFTGFLQVQQVDYQDDPSLENTFECTNQFLTDLENTPGIQAAVPRVETFALVSSGSLTKGALIIGIDPEREKNLSNPKNLLVRYRITQESIDKLKVDNRLPIEVRQKLGDILNNSYSNTGTIATDLGLDKVKQKDLLNIIASASPFSGKYLDGNDNGVLVSDRLAKYLKLSIGDSLILMGQGYHGSTAAGLYPVRGIVRFANPELDNKLIYMTLASAQNFASLENNVTTIAINLNDNSDEAMLAMQKTLNSKFSSSKIVVKNWNQFNRVLMQQIQSDNQSGKAFLVLLYFIIFFGIFGTVLMMIYERYHEFGVLVAIGMRKTKLALIMIYELFLIGLIGVVSGTAMSIPLIYILHNNPIHLTGDMAQAMEDMGFEPLLPLAWFDSYIFWQGFVVMLMVMLSCIYPLRKVLKLKEAEALRS